jgi:hypothetical protein
VLMYGQDETCNHTRREGGPDAKSLASTLAIAAAIISTVK